MLAGGALVCRGEEGRRKASGQKTVDDADAWTELVTPVLPGERDIFMNT